ncbi:MAG TPA: acyltransferase [Dongiaceae bacterium]|nr:acyltransferase [Dongiaceae bacterium]
MPRSERLHAIDGLRALAALGVLAYHLFDREAYYGLLGVELFFVISGLVILMTLERVRSLREFVISRAARLYPGYWLSVAATGTLLLLNHETNVRTVLLNATMAQAFIGVPDIIHPYWTLAYELWFYAVMAVIYRWNLLQRVDRIALAWLCLMFVYRASMLAFDRGAGLYRDFSFQLLLMPQFGHLFIAGMMIYRLQTGRSNLATRLCLGLSVAYSLFGRSDWASIPAAIYFPVNAAFILAVWAGAAGRLEILGRRPWLDLGLASYSLYLLHVPVSKVAFALFAQDHWMAVSISIIACIAAALLSRVIIEQPVQQWAKRALGREMLLKDRPAELGS